MLIIKVTRSKPWLERVVTGFDAAIKLSDRSPSLNPRYRPWLKAPNLFIPKNFNMSKPSARDDMTTFNSNAKELG